MNVIVRDKAEYHEQTTKRMEKHFVVPEWTVRQKLALAGRMLAADGHDFRAGRTDIRPLPKSPERSTCFSSAWDLKR